MTRPGVGSLRLGLILALGAGACAGAEPGSEAAPIDTSTIAVADSQPTAPEAEGPFRGFDIDRSAESRIERTVALRLRNDGSEDAVVYADAGAGEVLLDTVAAGRWSRVDLVSFGSIVTLRSARASGESTHQLDLAAVPDSIIEVNVGEPSATP